MNTRALHETLGTLDRLDCGLRGLIVLRSGANGLSASPLIPLHEGGPSS